MPQSPGEMAAVLRRAAKRVVPELEETVRVVLEDAKKIAEQTIGHGRREWPPFAEATVWDRRWVGPLERTGELRDSFRVELDGLGGRLVSSVPHVIYSEYGTVHEPPRPILVPSIRDALRYAGASRLRFVLTRAMT